jgi:putative acetyltransferase
VTIRIESFRDEHAARFYTLNRAWLDAHGLFEPHDDEQLRDPQTAIIAQGGAIFIALDDADAVVGTAAVGPSVADDELELIKLTVAESARGQGLGRQLAEECVAFARTKRARRLVLVSSTKLSPALRLYESMGFERKPVPATVPYETADVYMEMELG